MAQRLTSRASLVGAALWLFWSPPAQALELTPFLGARWLPLDTFHAGLDIGSGAGWLGERAARTQRLGQGGPTLHLGLTADFFDLVSTASYRHYLSAAPVSEIQIGIGFGYW